MGTPTAKSIVLVPFPYQHSPFKHDSVDVLIPYPAARFTKYSNSLTQIVLGIRSG